MNNFIPFGRNILIQPESKNKIIGNTEKYYLFGKVLAIGDEVTKIKVGQTLQYTLWGIKEVEHQDGTKSYFISENDDFILGVHD